MTAQKLCIIFVQKLRLASLPALAVRALRCPLYMTQVFNKFADSCAWLGGPCALQLVVDGYVNMLRDCQVGNAGTAQMFSRRQAFLVKKLDSDSDGDGYHYDSDDSLPSVAEEENWYNFEETDWSMERLQRLKVDCLHVKTCTGV